MRLAALLLLPGCVFYAKDTTSVRVVSEELVEVPLRVDPPIIIALARDARVRAFVSRPRLCRRDEVSNLEITHGKKLSFAIGAGDGYTALFALILAPITLPVSGLIAGISLGTHHDTITLGRKVKPNGVQPCPEVNTRPVTFTLPSGAVATVTSRPDGTAEIPIPEGEPETGAVTVSSPGAAAVALGYFKTYESCVAAREATFPEVLIDPAALPRLPRCETVVSHSDQRSERGWTMIVEAVIAAAHDDCERVFEHQTGIQNLLPAQHLMLYAHPPIAACVQRETARRASLTECALERSKAMRAAHAIKNPNQRGDALRRIPRCP